MYFNTRRWLVTICLSIAYKIAVVQSQIDFQIAPSNNTIARGTPVTFYCQVASSISISFSWRHNGTNIIYDNRVQQSVLPNGTLQLTIDPTMDGDNGNYSCVATDSSTQEEHIRTAYLQFAFIVEQFVRSPESKTATLGNPVQFFCIQDRSLPLAEIAWLKDGMLLPVSSSDRYSVQSQELLHDMGRVSSSLLIISVRSSDAGLYGCRAVNPLLTDNPVYSNNATLTVEVPPAPPTFLIDPSSVVLPAAGVAVTFSCSVTGSPIPSITWLHDNNAINSSDSITITTQEQTLNTTLTITNVQQSDSGNYQCRAENNGGAITSDPAMLQIASISQEFQVQPPAVVLAVLNTVTVIPCGPPISVPPATVEWSKDFRQLIDSRFVVDGSNLTILDTQLSDSGMYYCTAFNPLTTQSVVSQGANVSVKITPQFTNEPENRTAALNGRITFSCQASGDPSPTITWNRNQIPITGTDNRLQVVGGDLTIDPVMLSDDGSFTCEATNIVGAIQSTVYLNVQYPPEILPSFVSSMTAIEGHDALLNCAALGNPVPTVTWLFGTDQLPGVLSNGSIILSSVQISNEGNYTCRATNSLGSTEAILTLMIQVPAMISADQSNVTVVEGQSINLTCQASGDPVPSVTWYDREGDLLVEQGRRISINGGMLTFSPAMKSDEGIITCVATNSIRNSSASISLRVLVVSRIVQPVNISNIVLIEGNTLSLDCSASGDPAPVITWIVPSYTESQGADRLSTFSNGSLILFDVVKLDEGNYQCVATNDAGRDSVNVTITIWVPAIAQTRSSHSAVRGRNGILNCQAVGDPEPIINWLRNNLVLVNNTKYTILENGSLRIGDIEDSDGGNYSCQATNIAGTDIATTNLIIYIIPVVIIPNPQVIGVQGQSLVLRCVTSGFPNPVVTWYFNTREITVNDAPRLSVTPDGDLIINGVVTNDDGVYQCVATNAAGSDMDTVNLTIHVPPSVEAMVDSTTAVQGDTVTLSCVATGIPTPTIDWMHNGESVVNQGSRIMIVPSGDLTFDPVANDDEGTYQCFARNSAGVDDASITLTVFVPPRIIQGPVNTTVSEEDSTTLMCQVNGDPLPTVSWVFNGRTIVDDNAVLTISLASRDDTGYYTCVANNSVGMASSIAFLNVFYPPAITQHPVSLTVPENSSVTFTCEADANPLAVFQWLLNNQRLTSGDTGVTIAAGRLMITMASSSHVGVIACVAMNTEGTISSVATLTVLFRPTAPVNVIATVLSATSVNLSWDRPMNDGGTPLTNYIITYHSNAEDHMIVNTNNVQLTRQLDDLAPFTAYQLQVSAENIVGISPASVTVNVMTLVGAPSAPRFLNITASTETSVTLSWMPPDPPNGPLSVYSITYYAEDNELPRTILAFGTTLTISSLQSGVVYIVDVTASTISEESSLIFGVPATLRIMNGMVLPPVIQSSSSVVMSSTVLPSPSTTVTSVATSTSVSRAVTTSVVTTTSGTTTSSVIASSSSTTTTTTTSIAVSVISTTSVSTTTRTTTATSSLQSTTVLSTATSTLLSTTTASSTALSSMMSATNIITSQLSTTALSSTPLAVSPISTSVATSSSVIASPSPTPLLPPSVAPQWIAVQPLGRGTMYLLWSFTGDTNDGYIVLISPAPPDAPASRNVTDITLTLTGLADYTTYTFTVAAYNAAGVGPATSPQNATTVEGVPSAPRNVTVERISSNSIRVSWDPPELINGVLRSYRVQVMRSSSNVILISSMVNANESSDVIVGLDTGSYSVSVVAITGVGEGTPSDLVEFTLATTTIGTTSAGVSSTQDVPVTTSIPTTAATVTTAVVVPTETVITTSMIPNVTASPSANVTDVVVDDDDDDMAVLLEAIIPAGAVVIIIILFVVLIVWCWWRRKGSRKTRRYRINEQSKRPYQRRIIDDKADLVPFNEEDDDYFSSVQEALQTNFAFGAEDNTMHTFCEHPNNDYTRPPLIPEDELEHSGEDEFDGPYATADQVAQREKRMHGHQKTNDSNLEQSTFDTQSIRSSNSGTYISSDSIRAKKRQDRSMSLSRSATSGSGYNRNDDGDDDTGFSPVPIGTLKLDSENSLVNSDVSSND